MRNLNSDEMEVVVGGDLDVDEAGLDEAGPDELDGINEPA
jgi:hypothetical protein